MDFFKRVYNINGITIDCTVEPPLLNPLEFIMTCSDCNEFQAIDKWKSFIVFFEIQFVTKSFKPSDSDLVKNIKFFTAVDLLAFLYNQKDVHLRAASIFFRDYKLTEIFRLLKPNGFFLDDDDDSEMLKFINKVIKGGAVNKEKINFAIPPNNWKRGEWGEC